MRVVRHNNYCSRILLSEIPMESITSEADQRETSETLLVLQLASHVEGVLVSFCILLYQDKSMDLVLHRKNMRRDRSLDFARDDGGGGDDRGCV